MKISQANTFYLNKQNKAQWNETKAGVLEDSIELTKGLSTKAKEKLSYLTQNMQELLNQGKLDHNKLIDFISNLKHLGLSSAQSEVLMQNLIILADHRNNYYKISGLFGAASNTTSIDNFIKGQLSKTRPHLMLFTVDKHNFNNVLCCALIKSAIAYAYKDQELCDEANTLFEQLLKIRMSEAVRAEITEIANENIKEESIIFQRHVNKSMDFLSEALIVKLLAEDKTERDLLPEDTSNDAAIALSLAEL